MNKIKKSLFAVAIISAIASLAGCSGDEVSFASLEEAKGTARENASYNAARYRQENTMYAGWNIISRGDSTQDNKCPQGDGWATLEFVSSDQTKSIRVKCSTVSGNTGCIEDSQFKSKPFASDDGHCQPTNKVPYPLPKIAK